MVTISFFSRTFMRWKGIASAVDSLLSRSAKAGMARITAIMAESFSGSPAMVPLMPSAASRIVPRMPRAFASASSGARSDAKSGRLTNL